MRYRTIWISDLHLGTRHCDAESVLDFLKTHDCEQLYLVGDIVDLWHLRRQHYWPQSHNDVIQKILRKARKGTRITVIPGNHDEFLARFTAAYGNVFVKARDLHTTADGRRLLVMHGHEFDTVILHAKWLAYLGDAGYRLLLAANRPINFFRTRMGLSYWSLSAYAKRRVKGAVNFIGRFESALVHFALQHQADGIVCGHIHTPAIASLRDIAYYNCGDWIESRTALAEHFDGRMELLRWSASPARERQLELTEELAWSVN
jgi:UDP-2,3-diacylglucosamine pyrophosphatase LpxH